RHAARRAPAARLRAGVLRPGLLALPAQGRPQLGRAVHGALRRTVGVASEEVGPGGEDEAQTDGTDPEADRCLAGGRSTFGSDLLVGAASIEADDVPGVAGSSQQ